MQKRETSPLPPASPPTSPSRDIIYYQRTARVIFRPPVIPRHQEEVPFTFPGLDVAFNCIPSSGMSPMRTLILRRYYEPLGLRPIRHRQRTGISRFDNIIVAPRNRPFFPLSLSLSPFLSPLSLSLISNTGQNFAAFHPHENRSFRRLRRKYCWFTARTRAARWYCLKNSERRERGKRINRSSPMFNYRVLICIGTNTGGGVRSRKSLFESFRFHAFSFLSFLLAFVLATIIFYRAPTADRSVSSSVNATILQPLYNDRVYTGEEVYIYICACMCVHVCVGFVSMSR